VIAVVHFLVAYFSFPCIEIEDRKLATYWSQEHRKGIGLTTMLWGSSCLSSGASRAGESTVAVVTFQGWEVSGQEQGGGCRLGGRGEGRGLGDTARSDISARHYAERKAACAR
jgi:hypothetical protein